MSKQYFSLLTNYGTQAFAKAIGNKTPVPITHMAVGDGNGQNVTPTATQTTLIKEVYRAAISSMSVDPRNNKQIIFELIIPENIGGFYVREMGIYDNDNKLVAVANCPESFKPTLESGSGKVQVMRMILKVSSADAVTITMNNAIYATQVQLNPKTIGTNSINRVDDTGHSHEIDDATTEQAGIVQLTSDLTLDNERLALTAKAGKALKALIDAVVKNLANYIPNSKKSNAVDSTSSDTVATSLAAKTAYDKAVAAEELASGKYTAQNASTTQRGLTLHYSGYDSDSEELSASAKVIKLLKGFIDSNTRRFDNYIPNSKKSNAIDSSSSDTIATSFAVKRAYDNADARINRAGDTMTGQLSLPNVIAKHTGYGGYTEQINNSAPFFIDSQNSNPTSTYHPFVKGRVRDFGNWGAAFSFGYTTKQPGYYEYGDFGRGVICLNEDNGQSKQWRFEHNGDFHSAGDIIDSTGHNLRLLYQLFTNFRNKFTTSIYSGTSSTTFVFRIPLTDNLGVKMYASQLRIPENLYGFKFNLSESFSEWRIALASSADGHRRAFGAQFESDTQVLIHCEPIPYAQTVNLLIIGYYRY